MNEFLEEIRANRILQYGLIAIALLVGVELVLNWSDTLSAKEKQLQQLNGELKVLRNQSRDEDGLRRQLVELASIQETIDQRLWIVSSDAVGQARLKDWLTKLLKKAGASNFNLVLSAPRALGAREGGGGIESVAAEKTASANVATANDGVKNLREVRANIAFVFTPATLEQVLLDIEGGEPLAAVEYLSVSRRDRKVDMTVRVLMQIGRQAATGEAKPTAAHAEPGASDPATPLAVPEKTSAASLPQTTNGATEVKR